MNNCSIKPFIGITGDRQKIGAHWHSTVMEKYLQAVVSPMDGIPLLIPALAQNYEVKRFIDKIDGLLLTGAYSDVKPDRYGAARDPDAPGLFDTSRDAVSLCLIRTALEKDTPLLGICRGIQELNVALGGTLHQAVHQLETFDDHREDKTKSLDQQYAVSHAIYIMPGGPLSRLVSGRVQMVNSLHGQGIDKVAPGLQVEALSLDGLVEAVSVKNAKTFALAVQWHPEWHFPEHPFYLQLFKAFGRACRQHAIERSGQTC